MIRFAIVSGLIFVSSTFAQNQSQTPDQTSSLAPSQESATADLDNLRPGGGIFDRMQTDYSERAMFNQGHGDFILKATRFRPSIQTSLMLLPESDVTSEAGDFQLLHFNGDARVHIPMDPDNYAIVGGEIGFRRYQFDGGAAGAHDDTYYNLSANLGAGFFVEDNLLIEAILSPGIYSDLDGSLHSDDWKFFASGLATFRQDDNLFLKAGLEYSELFRDLNLVPLLGVSWLIDEEWRVDVLAPRYAEVSYAPDTQTTIFFGFDIDGDEYRVRAPSSAGAGKTNISVQEIRWGIGAQYRFTDELSGYARVGTTLAGDYKVSDGTGAKFDGSIEPQAFLEVGMGWDF